jgi:hypothetical protein
LTFNSIIKARAWFWASPFKPYISPRHRLSVFFRHPAGFNLSKALSSSIFQVFLVKNGQAGWVPPLLTGSGGGLLPVKAAREPDGTPPS